LHAVDAANVLGRAGIRQVVKLNDAVAVVAESWWRAKAALDALPVKWETGDAALSNSDIIAKLHKSLMSEDGEIGREEGDVGQALASARRRVEAAYSVPFLAHATMEPQNCTAHVTPDKVEVWAPTQDGEATLAVAAAAAGVPQKRVIVHKVLLGGGFGRRSATQDFVRQAVLIAKEVGRPVKLVWSREEDIRHDFYRPAAMATQIAGLDPAGMPIAWSVKIAAPSILDSLAPGTAMGGFDRQALHGFLDDMMYAVPNYSAAYAACETPVPLGLWRGVNHSQNAFFKECFVDEMAHAARQNPYLFRRRLLAQQPRLLAVLDAAAERAQWNTKPLAGRARGIAAHVACGSFCAQVVEVSVDMAGGLRIHRVVSAIDCGHAVNPQTVEAQTEGAIVYGLTAALYGEITIKNGGVEQSNFHDYEMLRMADMPDIETVIVPSGGFWGGVGEPPLTPLAPALCNAIFAGTGKRIRTLPIKAHDLSSR
jgi:isoquinoline 1-oxidoreductase beta subunit